VVAGSVSLADVGAEPLGFSIILRLSLCSVPLWQKGVIPMTDKIIVLVTCGSAKEARRIARALVEARFAACANVLETPVRSIYRWKGRVESAKECLLIIKTSRRRFAALEQTVKRLHSYDVPEIIALRLTAGSAGYLDWIGECVGTSPGTRGRGSKK
jgi:periplasmic divalent cation tolerance protein